jgi:hypothetical protein
MKKVKIKVLDNGVLHIKHSNDFKDVKEVSSVTMAAGTLMIMNSKLSDLEKAEYIAAIRLGLDTCLYMLKQETSVTIDDVRLMIEKLLAEVKEKSI